MQEQLQGQVLMMLVQQVSAATGRCGCLLPNLGDGECSGKVWEQLQGRVLQVLMMFVQQALTSISHCGCLHPSLGRYEWGGRSSYRSGAAGAYDACAATPVL